MHILEAPKSGILRNVLISDSSTVQTGKTIALFDDLDEQHTISQLRVLRGIAEAISKRMSPRRVQGTQDVLEVRRQNAKDIKRFRISALAERKQQVKVGEAFKNDVTFAATSLRSAEYDLRVLDLEMSLFSAQIDASRESLMQLNALIDRQEAILHGRMRDLQVVATHDGTVFWYAFEGGYIERGAPLVFWVERLVPAQSA